MVHPLGMHTGARHLPSRTDAVCGGGCAQAPSSIASVPIIMAQAPPCSSVKCRNLNTAGGLVATGWRSVHCWCCGWASTVAAATADGWLHLFHGDTVLVRSLLLGRARSRCPTHSSWWGAPVALLQRPCLLHSMTVIATNVRYTARISCLGSQGTKTCQNRRPSWLGRKSRGRALVRSFSSFCVPLHTEKTGTMADDGAKKRTFRWVC